jgi:ABC-type microcin C transport system duplicated ATPase subunit YejF
MALVGESGSGKSVSAMSILQLLPEGKTIFSDDSSIKFHHSEILEMSNKQLQSIRGKKISMIFQEPMTSLNPYHRVGNQITESILSHEIFQKKMQKRELKS